MGYFSDFQGAEEDRKKKETKKYSFVPMEEFGPGTKPYEFFKQAAQKHKIKDFSLDVFLEPKDQIYYCRGWDSADRLVCFWKATKDEIWKITE